MCRNRGLVQYFSPYISADLAKMALSFNTTIPNLVRKCCLYKVVTVFFSQENELMKLILDGSIQARIDSHNRVLLAQVPLLSCCNLYLNPLKVLKLI